jgi:hypothetical protein
MEGMGYLEMIRATHYEEYKKHDVEMRYIRFDNNQRKKKECINVFKFVNTG